jgi:ABC-type Zn uptake system ZnuABC Zn-binding protein ZnuA
MLRQIGLARLGSIRLAAIGLLGLLALSAQAAEHIVLTSLQATYSIASELAKGTQIKVINVPAQGAVMESQAHALSRVPDDVFMQAEAVITIGKLWRDDPLYPAARARNIHVVNIDASFPWLPGDPGVSVIRKPVSDVPWAPRDDSPGELADRGLSRFVWMSPTNAIRMAELIGGDLARLSVDDAAKIRANQFALGDSLRKLKAEYGAKYAELPDPRVFSLADEFVYLFGDLGVFVDGWFVKQDVNWTDADYQAFTAYLKEHQVRTVVHKWSPSEKIQAAIETAGAHFVILDAGDPGPVKNEALQPDGYQTLLRGDMDLLLQALSPWAPL